MKTYSLAFLSIFLLALPALAQTDETWETKVTEKAKTEAQLKHLFPYTDDYYRTKGAEYSNKIVSRFVTENPGGQAPHFLTETQDTEEEQRQIAKFCGVDPTDPDNAITIQNCMTVGALKVNRSSRLMERNELLEQLEEIDERQEDYDLFMRELVRRKLSITKTSPYPTMPKDRVSTRPDRILFDILNNIVNFGNKIWEVINKGRPVMTKDLVYANALPAKLNDQGVLAAIELEHWNEPVAQEYTVVVENILGMNLIEARFHIWRTTGGTFRPEASDEAFGKYIANATVVPGFVDMKWVPLPGGMKFDMAVKALEPTNIASRDDPIAALQLLLNFTVGNALREFQETRSYYIRANEGDYLQ